MQIISNNPKVKEQISQCPVIFVDGTFEEVLQQTYKKIVEDHHVMLTHPLSSSIKPNETYYKSIIITTTTQSQIDYESLELIENALATHEKFNKDKRTPQWTDQILEDFATIDLDLMESTLQRIRFSPEIRFN
ncbi:GrdX family protein [Facklamia sp. DSM 111018]|uniref:GrdX family protein n=1 Tax=Facklamia lactis TaxID=2749967 RepID=A0ABS0LPQ5_9LACT|nr:GrdX family protein [Facklamia lactis]MBG9980245.1 GrdX family protein [Facklamia lactis]MBG9986048.1 GrdX family protein [Facklamia lactis]